MLVSPPVDEGERLTLAQLVRLAREEAGLTQAEAAEALGIHKNAWQNFEYGKGRPDLYVKEIEEALGLDEGWFSFHRDPYAKVVRMAGDIEAIRETLEKRMDELETLIRRLL